MGRFDLDMRLWELLNERRAIGRLRMTAITVGMLLGFGGLWMLFCYFLVRFGSKIEPPQPAPDWLWEMALASIAVGGTLVLLATLTARRSAAGRPAEPPAAVFIGGLSLATWAAAGVATAAAPESSLREMPIVVTAAATAAAVWFGLRESYEPRQPPPRFTPLETEEERVKRVSRFEGHWWGR